MENARIDKEPLVAELGLDYNASYSDILERIQQIKREYEANIDQLHATLEQEHHER